MKKSIIRIMILMIILSLTSCTEHADNASQIQQPTIEISGGVKVVDTDFVSETYNRNQDYPRTFHMSYYGDDEISIGFLEGLYTDNELSIRLNQIKSDYEVIKNKLDVIPDVVNLYVLEETIAGGSYIVGDSIFCDQADFESGDYKKLFIKRVLGIEDQWIVEGLHGYVYGDYVDTKILADYYESADDLSVLSLSYLRFIRELNTEQDLEIAIDTSVAIASFVVQSSGYEALDGWLSANNINMWLQFIGADVVYEDPYDGLMSRVHFDVDGYYIAKVTTENDVIYLDIVEESVEGAEDMERFIYRVVHGHAYILNYLMSEAPGHFTGLYEGPITYYLSDDIYQSQINAHSIRMNHDGALNILMSQLILEDYQDNLWTIPILTNHISRVQLPNELSTINEHIYAIVTEGTYEEAIYTQVFDYVRTYMNGKGVTFDDIDGFVARYYYDATAFGQLQNPDFMRLGALSVPIYEDWQLDSAHRMTGDELTYSQAISFVAYLIDTYSLDAYMVLYESSMDFVAAYGKDYNILKLDWRSYLEP